MFYGYQMRYQMTATSTFIIWPPLSRDNFSAPPYIQEPRFTWTLMSQPCRSRTWTHRTCCLLTAMCSALHWLLLTAFTWAPYCSSSSITSAWSLQYAQFLINQPSAVTKGWTRFPCPPLQRTFQYNRSRFFNSLNNNIKPIGPPSTDANHRKIDCKPINQ